MLDRTYAGADPNNIATPSLASSNRTDQHKPTTVRCMRAVYLVIWVVRCPAPVSIFFQCHLDVFILQRHLQCVCVTSSVKRQSSWLANLNHVR
jgi:hypothetical protein